MPIGVGIWKNRKRCCGASPRDRRHRTDMAQDEETRRMEPHEHVCQHHSAASTGSCASHGSHEHGAAPTCGGAGPCGGTAECAAETGASCGHCSPLSMPATDEQVTIPANDL